MLNRKDEEAVPRVVYVWQWEQWWSIPIDAWLELALEPKYYNLDEMGKRIKPPYKAVWNAGSKDSSQISPRPGVLIAVMPCDWSEDDWRLQAEELLKLNQELLQSFLDALAEQGSTRKAAAALGCSHELISKRFRLLPDNHPLKERYQKFQGKPGRKKKSD
jgi:hypothetical protein